MKFGSPKKDRHWLSVLGGWRLAVILGILAVAVPVGFGLRAVSQPQQQTADYTEALGLVAQGSIARARVAGSEFGLDRTSGAKLRVTVDDPGARHDLIERIVAAKVPLRFEAQAHDVSDRPFATLLPILAIAAVGGFLAIRFRRRVNVAYAVTPGQLAGQAVGFADVAGMEEVKAALVETVEFLKNPTTFGRLGGRAPRGVLLTGGPGTGKTLLARAVAAEAGVPFLTATGSSFQEMFVGVGASRVRNLFAEARRIAPCIVFIDEIDAVGRSRGKSSDSAASDHDQTLNQLLVEMDGFDRTTGIVVIASTNRPDILDPAILRPGRFDRQIVVPLPDLRGRLEILGVHARSIELTADVNLPQIARGTPGFSGADLANLLNEAAILAAREGAQAVENGHIDRARDRVIMGTERRILVDERERFATAVHEAGHVAVGIVAEHTDPVYKVSILPRGRSLGVTHSLPERDRLMVNREYLEDQICLMLGGRAAEVEILGTMTAGAADDLERATRLGRRMVAEFGMSDLGPVCVSDACGPTSQALLDRVEETTRRLLDGELTRARRIVAARRVEIEKLVGALLERETLDAEEIRACFGTAAPPPAS